MIETQATIDEWANEAFGAGSPESPAFAFRMPDEAIELCLVAGCDPYRMRRRLDDALAADEPHDGPRPRPVPAGSADVAITLYRLAARFGFDPDAEVDRKMAINRIRTWQGNGDGTGRHVRQGVAGG